MRYVAAYLLAVLGGNASPSSKDIKHILGSVGIEADDERLDKVNFKVVTRFLFRPRVHQGRQSTPNINMKAA